MRARILLLLATITVGFTSILMTASAQGTPALSVTMTGPSTIMRSGLLQYTLRITNATSVPMASVSVVAQDPSNIDGSGIHTELTPEGLGTGCQFTGARQVLCGSLSIPAYQTVEVTFRFRVSSAATCGKSYGLAATVTSAQSATVMSGAVYTGVSCAGGSSSSAHGLTGCISILAEGFDRQGNKVHTLPSFTYRLHNGGQTVSTDAGGLATIYGVPPGTHGLSQSPQPGWHLLNATPAYGIVQVAAGPSCAGVVFKNQLVSEDDDDDEDLSLDVRDTPDPVAAGGELEYEIKIRNRGDDDREIDVRAELDDETTFLAASDDGKLRGGDEVRWDDIEVDEDDTTTLILRVRVKSGARDGDSLRLRVRAGGEEETETTRVRGEAAPPPGGALTIRKQADRYEAAPGADVTYSITVQNGKAQRVTNLQVTDTFDPSHLIVTDPDGGQLGHGQIVWNIASLEANQTRVLQFRASLSQSLRQGDTVQNVARLPDGQTAVASIGIVTRLPQTGIVGFTSPFENTRQYLRFVRGKSDAAGGPVGFAWLGLLVGGIGAGAGIGRRYFL